MNKIILVLFSFLFWLNLGAQELSDQLNQYLDAEIQKFKVPDLEVRVVTKDSIAYSRSIGESASPYSPYYIGSVSKSLTAFGVLRLVQQKKLSFESIVSELLPEIEFANGNKEISIRHLLNHSSGIKKRSGFAYLPTLAELKNSKHLIDNESIKPLRHEYSNLNYSILGLVIEKVTQLSFGEYMEQAVFSPLEMKHALIGMREQLAPKLIKHYQYFGPFPVERPQLDFAESSIPAGFIGASSEDLGNYLQMNLANGNFRAKQLMDTSLLQRMQSVWDGSDYGYAMGWKKGYYNDRLFFQHLGATANSYSGIFFIPEKELGLVFLTNSNSLNFSEDLAEGLLNILTDGEPKEISRSEFYIRIALFIGLLFLFIHFFYQLAKIIGGKIKFSKKDSWMALLFSIFSLIVLIFIYRESMGISFFSFCKIQPDIGFFMFGSLISPIVLNLLKIIRSWTNPVVREANN